MFALSAASREALDAFCVELPDSQADLLRRQVNQVCADPSGRRRPPHRLTRPFRTARRYIRDLEPGQSVFEFKTNHIRGLFVVDNETRTIVFAPVKGRRFFRSSDAPWPH